MSCKRNI